MDHEDHCDALEADATRLAELVGGADLTVSVPTCPGWTVADLVGHVGTLYRWSAAHVATSATARIAPDTLDLGLPPDGPSAAWLADGIAPMLQTFRSADPSARAWGWGGDRHARFWPRRMLVETVVHRADAAFALDLGPEVEIEVETGVARDGIDELLSNLPHAAYFAPGIAELRSRRREGDERVALRSSDADGAWCIRLVPAGYAWDWTTGPADVTVRGRTADLLLLLYSRRRADESRFERDGDLALLDRFLAHAQL
jgi:uncharacterized protein (TIGR03083 family)